MTDSYAILNVSPRTHAEIKSLLMHTAYHHAIQGETLFMGGLCLEPQIAIDCTVQPEEINTALAALTGSNPNIEPAKIILRKLLYGGIENGNQEDQRA